MIAMNRIILPIYLLAALPAPAASAAAIPGPIPAVVERVVDGDTVRVSARIWIDQQVAVSVRVRGVDAPELFRPRCETERTAAHAAKQFVEDFLAGEDVLLADIEHDKYGGRVVARVLAAGRDLGDALIAEGHAAPIGADDPWCG